MKAREQWDVQMLGHSGEEIAIDGELTRQEHGEAKEDAEKPKTKLSVANLQRRLNKLVDTCCLRSLVQHTSRPGAGTATCAASRR